MIVEVRSYRIKPGRREEFIQFFETRAVPAQHTHGMKILGPLLDLENPNKFVFLRSFPSLDERDRMKDAFYEGDLWKNELEAIAMPMIDSYDVILCETSNGCVFDELGE
jgi:hypothetical protein